MAETATPGTPPGEAESGGVERRISEVLTDLAQQSADAADLIASITPPG